MNDIDTIKHYSPLEEKLNVLSHGLGFLLSFIALYLLVQKGFLFGHNIGLISFIIYGCSLLLLYASSTLYHSSIEPKRRRKLRTLDHISIYFLIAGTYTPFCLVTLSGSIGWWLFCIVWTIALIGTIIKFFFTGRFTLVSTLAYVFMGWLAIFAIKPLLNSLDASGLNWLLGGGLAYTTGAILYSIKRIPFHHAIFHVFVLAGSFCHFMAVYYYVE